MLRREEKITYSNRDVSRATRQRTELFSDFNSDIDEEEQPVLLEAALCKCVLDPRSYDNYLFWELV